MNASKPTPARLPLNDLDANRALDELRHSVTRLARDPFLNAQTLEVSLPDATIVPVAHGLGRRFTNFWVSPPVGPVATGRIEELAATDPSKELWLRATGFGATVTVRVTVF